MSGPPFAPLTWPGLGPAGGPYGPVVLTRPDARPAPCDHDPDAPWAHSWDPDGVRACWRPDVSAGHPSVAIDLERGDRPVPTAVRRRRPDDTDTGAWVWWCTTEVIAKVSGITLERLLRRPDEAAAAAAGIATTVVRRDGWVLVLGVAT